MSRPRLVERIKGWRFERWEYEGAPLIAVREPASRFHDTFNVEIDEAGDLTFDGVPHEGFNPTVPAEVLTRLIEDARQRRAPGWDSGQEHDLGTAAK